MMIIKLHSWMLCTISYESMIHDGRAYLLATLEWPVLALFGGEQRDYDTE